ncbi:hypothetical protein [Moraxella lacunata]
MWQVSTSVSVHLPTVAKNNRFYTLIYAIKIPQISGLGYFLNV